MHLVRTSHRFYDRLEDYRVEARMFSIPNMRQTLPNLYASHDNVDSMLRGPQGFVFPPFLVTERGQPLTEWLQGPRDNLLLLAMVRDLAELLAALHAAGHVHRDVKPDNVLLMLQTQAWRLIDFGISAPIGANLSPTLVDLLLP
jgi:serine/threonine protein kinase